MSDKATTLEEVDALQYERLVLQLQNLDLQKQLIQAQLKNLDGHLVKKYEIGEADRIDLASRTITRSK